MNLLFTLLALLSLAGALTTLVALVGARRSPGLARLRARISSVALPLATAVAAVCTSGSLYYSEVAGFTPCTLCWYQRFAMYPLVVILAAAGLWARNVLIRIGLLLASIGAVISAYHWAIELNPSLQLSNACSASVPCTAAWVSELGFVSIAFMALSGFLFIITLLAAALRAPQQPAAAGAQNSRERSRPRRPARDSRTLAAAGIGIAAVVVAGLVLPNPGAPPADAQTTDTQTPGTETPGTQTIDETQATAPVEVTGEPLPMFADPGNDAAVGKRAPEVVGETFDKQPAQITFDGTPKAILFVAHWCPHCQNEVPAVQAWLDDNGDPEGVDIATVSTGVDPSAPNYPPAEWLEREGWTPPVLVDDGDGTVAAAYGLSGYPYWVFVEGDGTVVARTSGELPIDQLEQMLATLAGS